MDGSILPQHEGFRRHKLTVQDYHRMGEVGILTREARVELIDGELIAMAPIGPEHANLATYFNTDLAAAVGGAALVAMQNPLRLDDGSEPQPDLMLIRPRPGRPRRDPVRPADVLLLIEVADSSLRFDRAVKAPLYAAHGIPELWIVDVAANRVEVCRDPGPAGYAGVETYGPDATLSPRLLPDVRLPLRPILG